MNRYLLALACGLIMVPNAVLAGDSFKCVAPDGKVTYSGQVSSVPSIKCEKMFARKVTAPVEPAPETGSASESQSQNPATPAEQAAKPAEKSVADKTLEAKRKQAGAEDTKKAADEAKKKAAQDEQKKQADQKIKEENCANAKSNLRTYTHGTRVTKIDEKGEKVFLEDSEIKQKAEEAQKEIDKWCSS